MSQKLFVRLSEEERTALEKMTRSGTGKARQITRARILLMADPNQAAFKTQEQSAHALGISPVTVCRVCRRFAEQGREKALVERPRGAPAAGTKAQNHGRDRSAFGDTGLLGPTRREESLDRALAA